MRPLLHQWIAREARGERTPLARVVRHAAHALLLLGLVGPVGPLASCGSGGGASSLFGTAEIAVSGEADLAVSGPVGGPFAPSSVTYTIANTGDEPVEWDAVAADPWLTIAPANGTLGVATTVEVVVAIASAAVPTQPGSHATTVSFHNLVSGIGDATRTATVAVTAPTGEAMTTARRTSGVAPFAVTFDAVGAASGVVQAAGTSPDWGAMHHEWDFGDPASGTWSHSGKSKNRASGFVASHVYETPGTYVVQLTVRTAEGTSHEYTQQITVQSADAAMATTTFYVSTAGDDANSGTTQQQAFRTPGRGFAALFAANGPRRLLFRRGDTFTTTQTLGAGPRTGPYVIGAFGNGAKPVIAANHGADGFSYTQVADLRIVDVDFSGPHPSAAGNGLVPGRDCLLLRSRVRGFNYGMILHQSSGDHAGNTIADCEIVDNGTYGVYYAAGPHFAVLGTRFDNSIGNSLLRAYLERSVWQSNLFQRAGQSAVRIMGRTQAAPSNFVVVADNTFESTTTWVFEIGPENTTSAQYAEDILVEGNRFLVRSGAQGVVLVFAPKVTIRNNVFDVGGAWPVQVQQRGIGPVPNRVRVHNNSAFRATGSPLHLCSASSSDSTDVSNNIVWCANGTSVVATGSCSAANNLTANPGFVDAPNGDFRLLENSDAIDGGRAVPVRVDFDRADRPKGAAIDIGAFERQD